MLARCLFAATVVSAWSLVPAPAALAQLRAPDGVTINEEGLPRSSTFSLCAIDPATGQSGAAVTTRVPFVGRAVPHVRAGVGAVCTQASTMVEYGPRGLDLLAKGVVPADVLQQLLAERQAARVAPGRRHRHAGARPRRTPASRTATGPAASRGGTTPCRPTSWSALKSIEAVAATFEATEGSGWPLAERMILALEAGQAKGGDRRWGSLQSAAIKIADPKNPGRGGDYIALAIEVGEHPEPVAEMKRIYYTTARRLGYRSFSRIEGPDVSS